MQLTPSLAALSLLLVTLAGANADQMPGQGWQDNSPSRPPMDYGYYQGGGNPYTPHRPHSQHDIKSANGPIIDPNSPLCGQFVGNAGDGVNRTESARVSDSSNNPSAFHSWIGVMKQDKAKADIKINLNSEGILEIKIRNVNDGVKFANKIAISPVFTDKAKFPAPTRWLLDANKSQSCHYRIARKPAEIGMVYVRF